MPRSGHTVTAASSASCTASSAASKSARRRISAPSTRGASSRSRGAIASSGAPDTLTPRAPGAQFDRDLQRPPARARRRRCLGGHGDGAFGRPHVADPEPGQELLRLREGPVADDRLVGTAGAHELCVHRHVETFGDDQFAVRGQLLVEGFHERDVGAELGGNPPAQRFEVAAGAGHQQHVLHGFSSGRKGPLPASRSRRVILYIARQIFSGPWRRAAASTRSSSPAPRTYWLGSLQPSAPRR